MATRAERLSALDRAITEYYGAEKSRIENEVMVLESVLSGRTGGLGIQTEAQNAVEAVAQNDLRSFVFPEG